MGDGGGRHAGARCGEPASAAGDRGTDPREQRLELHVLRGRITVHAGTVRRACQFAGRSFGDQVLETATNAAARRGGLQRATTATATVASARRPRRWSRVYRRSLRLLRTTAGVREESGSPPPGTITTRPSPSMLTDTAVVRRRALSRSCASPSRSSATADGPSRTSPDISSPVCGTRQAAVAQSAASTAGTHYVVALTSREALPRSPPLPRSRSALAARFERFRLTEPDDPRRWRCGDDALSHRWRSGACGRRHPVVGAGTCGRAHGHGLFRAGSPWPTPPRWTAGTAACGAPAPRLARCTAAQQIFRTTTQHRGQRTRGRRGVALGSALAAACMCPRRTAQGPGWSCGLRGHPSRCWGCRGGCCRGDGPRRRCPLHRARRLVNNGPSTTATARSKRSASFREPRSTRTARRKGVWA